MHILIDDVKHLYGSYLDIKVFLQNAVENGLLEAPSLILGGNLNLILLAREVWGTNYRLDPLVGWFN